MWGGVAALLLLLAPIGERLAAGLPPCPVHEMLAIPCLTCGATRAALALARLDLAGAFLINPLASLAWIVLIAGGLVAGAMSLLDRPAREPDWRLSVPTRWLLATAMVANWVYLVATDV